jgi:hypothetical protein
MLAPGPARIRSPCFQVKPQDDDLISLRFLSANIHKRLEKQAIWMRVGPVLAQRQGWVADLIEKASEEQPNSAALKQLRAKLRAP